MNPSLMTALAVVAAAAGAEDHEAPAKVPEKIDHGLALRRYPDELLRQKCALVVGTDLEKYAAITVHMQAAGREWKGYAVAAPQVGIDAAFFVLRDDAEVQKQLGGDLKVCSEPWPTFIANPVIVARSGKVHDTEACLSYPHPRPTPAVKHLMVKIRRPARIDMNYLDHKGVQQSLTATGLLARVLCHEIDHLAGITLIDHLEGKDRAKVERAVAGYAD